MMEILPPDFERDLNNLVERATAAAKAEVEEQRNYKNAAYHERNQLVAALSKLFPASLEPHQGEDWGPDWQWVVFIDIPKADGSWTGTKQQISWHIMTSELPLFDHLARNVGRKWDGYDNDEKYRRLNELDSIMSGGCAVCGDRR